MDLEELPSAIDNKNVPAFVDFCCKIIEKHGLDHVGLYRIPGNTSAISAVQKRFPQIEQNYIQALENSEANCNINAYCSALKNFLRTLPEPLIPRQFYDQIIAANRNSDKRLRMINLQRVINKLPRRNFETLRYLSAHLGRVAVKKDTNKMDYSNLAIIFGPTLLRAAANNNNQRKHHYLSNSSAFLKKPLSIISSHDRDNILGFKGASDTLDQCLVTKALLEHVIFFSYFQITLVFLTMLNIILACLVLR